MGTRHRREVLLAGLFLLCFAFSSLITLTSFFPESPASLEVKHLPKVRVERIIDGDTLEVILQGKTIRVRLLGIDTPEKGEPLYQEAKGELSRLAGKVVYLEADQEEKDRYGRYLFWVWSEEGVLINAALVRGGLADCFFRPSFRGRKHALELLYEAFEAAKEKKGIWAPDYKSSLALGQRGLSFVLPF